MTMGTGMALRRCHVVSVFSMLYAIYFTFLIIIDNGTCLDFFDFDELFTREAEMLPEDITMFVEDKIKVYCSLSSSSSVKDPSDLYYKLTYKDQNITEFEATILNSTHVMTILEGTETMKGRSTLACMSRKKDELSSISIFVQERLMNVTNVSSIYYYAEKKFVVSWNLGAAYFQPEYNIEVESYWFANDLTMDKIGNACNSSTSTECIVYPKYQSILLFHIITNITSKQYGDYLLNRKNFVQPQSLVIPHYVYQVQPKKKVKTGHPKKVEIEGRASRCVNISWTLPDFFRHFREDNLYRIVAKQDNHQNFQELVNSRMEFSKEETKKRAEACGLVPNTGYELGLQVKPVDGGYWSELSTMITKTLEDRPEYGPLMTHTSFWVGMCNGKQREMIVYWKDLTEKEKNGVLTNFLIYFNSEEVEVRGSSNNIKVFMDCDVTYNVQVYSSTEVGLTLNPSRLTIPSENEAFHSPFPVDLKVEKLSVLSRVTDWVSVNVTWAVKDLRPFKNISIILYFCQGQAFSTQVCIDDLRYRVVPFENLHLELQNISQSVNRFGYALEKNENCLTGITWVNCIYDRKEKPGQVTGVNTYPGEETGSIRVVWEAQRCSKETLALVQHYYVQYCTQSQLESGSRCPEEKVTGGDSSSLILHGLDSKNYSIKVCAEAWSGRGLCSVPVTSKPSSRSEQEDPLQTIILIIALIAVLIAGAVVFVYCKFRQRKKKMDKQICYPYTPFDVFHQGKKYENQLSDSGISMNSTQVVSTIVEEIETYGDDVDPPYNAAAEISGQSNPEEQICYRPIDGEKTLFTVEHEGNHLKIRTEEENPGEPEMLNREMEGMVNRNCVTDNKFQHKGKMNNLPDLGTVGTGNNIETDTDAQSSDPYMKFNTRGGLEAVERNENGCEVRDESQNGQEMKALGPTALSDGALGSSAECSANTAETDLLNSTPNHSDPIMRVANSGDLENPQFVNGNDNVAKDEPQNTIMEEMKTLYTTVELDNSVAGNSINSSEVTTDTSASNSNPSDSHPYYMRIAASGELKIADRNMNVARDESQSVENSKIYLVNLDESVTGNNLESSVDTDTYRSNSNPSDSDSDAYGRFTASSDLDISDTASRNDSNGSLDIANRNKDDYFANDEPLKREEENIKSWAESVTNTSNRNPGYDAAALVGNTLFSLDDEHSGNSLEESLTDTDRRDPMNNNPTSQQTDPILIDHRVESIQNDNINTTRDKPLSLVDMSAFCFTDEDDDDDGGDSGDAIGNSLELLVDTDTDRLNINDTDGSNNDSNDYTWVGAVGNGVIDPNNVTPSDNAVAITKQPTKATDSIQESDGTQVVFKSGQSTSSSHYLNQNPSINNDCLNPSVDSSAYV